MLQEVLKRKFSHLDHYFKIKDVDSALGKARLYEINACFIMFFEKANFFSQSITGYIFIQHDSVTSQGSDILIHISDDLKDLENHEINHLITLTIYLINNYASYFMHSKLNPSLLDLGIDHLNFEIKKLKDLTTLRFEKIKEKKKPKLKTINPQKDLKSNEIDALLSANFHKFEKAISHNKQLISMGLAIYKLCDININNPIANFAIHPVLVQYKAQKSLAKKLIFSKKQVDQFYNEELLIFHNICQNLFPNMTNDSKANFKLLYHMSAHYWQVFKNLPAELCFFAKDSKFYHTEIKSFTHLKLHFKLKKYQNDEWSINYSLYQNKELLVKSLDNPDFTVLNCLGSLLFVNFLDDKAIIYESNLEQNLSDFFSLFIKSEFTYQEILLLKKSLKRFNKNIEIEIDSNPYKILKIQPTPILYFDNNNIMNLRFDYDPKNYQNIIKGHIINEIEPDLNYEKACIKILDTDACFRKRSYSHFHDLPSNSKQLKVTTVYHLNLDFQDWLIEYAEDYINAGFEIFSEKGKKRYSKINKVLSVKTQNNHNWFEFQPYISDENGSNEIQISSIDYENNTVTDINQQQHRISPEDIEKLKKYRDAGQFKDNKFRVPSANSLLLESLIPENKRINFKEIIRQNQEIKKFEKIKAYDLTKDFQGELRKYQKAGYDWLNFLNEYNFHGCLADDMGLGKTVQTLALLQNLKSKKNLNCSLLIVPLSAVPNWEDEINKFSPSLVYFTINGKNAIDLNDYSQADLVISSYATIRQRIEIFKDFEFDYIILDESQNIKNYSTMTAQAIKTLNSKHRLALSGTPIENNLSELWSLYDFLMPGFLGDIAYFKDCFMDPIVKDQNAEKRELLKKLIFPFILRRRKQDVEIDLPEKVENIIHVEMNPEMEKLYQETAKYYRETISESIDSQGVNKSAMKIFEGMLRLRQICLFPALLNKQHENIDSPKFEFLQELLEDILKENHKILIFSQFTGVLDIIESYINQSKHQFLRIDGSTSLKKREKNIKEFQNNPEKQIFLLSLKSGGVALNLTAADYVLIFDPWWNPAVEAQAIDRAHRMGQVKKVIAYRLIVKNSIEDKILKLQDSKKELVESLISEDSGIFKKLSGNELLDLFK